MNRIMRLSVFAVLMVVPSVLVARGKTIYNFIEYDAAFWPKKAPATAQEYRTRVLDWMKALPFDTLAFAPVFDFGSYAANMKSAQYPTHQPQADSKWMNGWRNAMPEFIKSGVDPIEVTTKWCRDNKREAVVAMPVNPLNTHISRPGAKSPPNSWGCYLWSPFKAKNPDCMISEHDYCVDYTKDKVRKTFLDNATEICGKYDIDGLLIDFSQRPRLFASVAAGGTAAPKELTLITQMMTAIKAECKKASARLGHPVSFGARVPDSIGYCKDIGIDLQTWLDSKLLDYVVIGGYFKLNRCNVVGDVAIKAGVPYYISVMQSGIHVGNDSGYSGDDERLPRNSKEVARAQIADALRCKAAGCMFTSGTHWDVSFNPEHIVPYDEKANRTGNKRYFVSYTNDELAGSWLKDWTKYRLAPSLLSGRPIDLAGGLTKQSIEVWEDFAALKKDGIEPKVSLVTEIMIPSGIEIELTFNGKPMKCYKKRAGTQYYALVPTTVKYGANEVTVKSKGKNRRGETAKLGNIAVEVIFPKPGEKKEGGK